MCSRLEKKGTHELIGYASFLLSFSFHYAAFMQAHADTIYIIPECRGIGHHLIEFCDKALKDMGVRVVYQHVSRKKDFSKSLRSLGYEHAEDVYLRRFT